MSEVEQRELLTMRQLMKRRIAEIKSAQALARNLFVKNVNNIQLTNYQLRLLKEGNVVINVLEELIHSDAE